MSLGRSIVRSEARFYRFINLFYSFCFAIYFITNKIGREYRISSLRKLKLVIKIARINKKYNLLLQHLQLVHQIFRLPKALKGDVVECGCFNGTSTISLSLACALTNRRLFVCDSFEGLAKPREDEKYAIVGYSKKYYLWQEGEYASLGGLEQVKQTISKFGNIEVCQFIKGYFKDILKDIDTDSIVLVFEDADLVSSVEDCLWYLWPKLKERCRFYSHEPWSVDVVSLFYNKEWWKRELKTEPPGFFGPGHLLSGIGYAMKFKAEEIKKNGKRMVHAGTKIQVENDDSALR